MYTGSQINDLITLVERVEAKVLNRVDCNFVDRFGFCCEAPAIWQDIYTGDEARCARHLGQA
jgi:hypothetical protein